MARGKTAAQQPTERVCVVCGASKPPEGPLPWSWDVHPTLVCTSVNREQGTITYRGGPMEFSCSAECRANAGLKERKGGGRNG